jgi:hypothetical protein
MTGIPDHTDQRELLKKFLGEGRPATPEAIAQVVEAGAAGHRFGQTQRGRAVTSPLGEVTLGLGNAVPAGLEQMMRQGRSVRQAEAGSCIATRPALTSLAGVAMQHGPSSAPFRSSPTWTA